MSTFTFQDHHDIDISSAEFDSDIFEPSEHDQHRPKSLSRALLPAIPDLRFEQSYLKSIRGFVHVEGELQGHRVVNGKGKGKEKVDPSQEEVEDQNVQVIRRHVIPIVDSSHHLVKVEWSQVAWVTTRDQVISPLLQGALWGIASYFLRPFMSLVGSHIRLLVPSVSSDQAREPGWWKWWTHGLGLGSSARGSSRTSTDIPTR